MITFNVVKEKHGWAILDGLLLTRLVSGLALMALACGLLVLWERLAWEPFVERLPELS